MKDNEVECAVVQTAKLASVLLWRPEFYPTPLHDIFVM